MPYLRKGVGEQIWDIATLLPGDRPLHSLAAALVPILEPEMTETDRLAEIGKLAGHFAKKSVALRDVVARILEKQPGTGHLLLVVDQWEELYTLVRDDQMRQRFLGELLEATGGGMLTTVLTLRGDFFGRALSHRALADRLQNVNLGPMTREELEYAIEAPAQKVGLTFEPGLVGRIIDDVEKEPGSLPLLEFFLTGLWERRRAGMLHHEAYEDMGEVRGAMARRADEVFEKLSPEDQKLVRRVVVQLVRPGEGTQDTGRRATFAEVGEAARPVVQRLADARLTVTGRNESGEQTIEVAHEALIHNWDRLRDWMDEDREFLLWRQRLRAHLDEWEDADHNADELLRGVMLGEAKDRYQERIHELSGTERRFIKESLLRQEQQERARRRRIAITKLVAVVMTVLAIGASLAGWYASEQKKIALAQKLLAQAELMTSHQPSLQQRGVLLAVESMRLHHSLEADQVLRHGLALLAQPIADVEHEGIVRCVVFSPPYGQYVATASDPNAVRVWDAASGKKVARIDHEAEVLSVVFSPNGKLLATASMDCSARVWDTNESREVVRIDHEDTVSCVAFNADGNYVATASMDCSARIWDANSGEEVARMVHETSVSCITFSPDGNYVATASADPNARVWDVNSGTETASLPHNGAVEDVGFSPDGRYLATASEDGTACLWDWKTKQKVSCMKHEGIVYSVVFSPTGKCLATACLPDVVKVWGWNATGCEEVTQMKHEASVLSMVFSRDGRYLATASDCNTAQVWDPNSGKEMARMNHDAEVLSVAFSPDGKRVATASRDKMMRVWKATAGDEFVRMDHDKAVRAIAFSPDGKCIVTACDDNMVRLWDTTSGDLRVCTDADRPVLSLTFSPDGTYVATASDNNTVRLWDVANDVWGPPLLKEEYLVHDIAFGPNEKLLATTAYGHTAAVRNVTDRNQVTLSLGNLVRTAAYSPDGKYLATGFEDDTAALWDVTNAERIHELEHEGDVSHVKFSPEGKYLATVSKDRVVRVWDVISGEKVAEMKHEAKVSCIIFSLPEGKHLATGSKGGTVRIWDVRTGLEATRMRHDGDVYSVVFSPDGKYVATASKDETARIWIWRRDDLIDLARSRLARNLTSEEWQRYLPGEPYRQTFPDPPDPHEHKISFSP